MFLDLSKDSNITELDSRTNKGYFFFLKTLRSKKITPTINKT